MPKQEPETGSKVHWENHSASISRTRHRWDTASLFPWCPGLLETSVRCHMLKPLQYTLLGPNHSMREDSKMQAVMSWGTPIQHLTPWSLSHTGLQREGAIPFEGWRADISVQTPAGQPGASLVGRPSDPLGLRSSSCDTTTAQPRCWPGGVAATPAPARNVWQQAAHAQLKVVRIWPFEGRTWALELICHCQPQEPDWPWGCFIWKWNFYCCFSLISPRISHIPQNIRAWCKIVPSSSFLYPFFRGSSAMRLSPLL